MNTKTPAKMRAKKIIKKEEKNNFTGFLRKLPSKVNWAFLTKKTKDR